MAGKRGKTIRQLLEESGLPEEYQDLILDNYVEKGNSVMKRHQEWLHTILKDSFTWELTKQRHIFWAQVYSHLIDPQEQLPQIIKK